MPTGTPHRFILKSAPSLALSLFLLATLPAAELPCVPPGAAGLSAGKLQKVDRFMQGEIDRHEIAGAVVIVSHDGKVGFFHAYGWRDLAAQKPMQPDTIVRLYSMSKAITCAAAMTLYEDGKLGLDDPVSKYIPGFAAVKVATPQGLRGPKRAPTIRDLMRHTSGLTYGSGPEAVQEAYAKLAPWSSPNLKEFADRISRVPLAFDPGTQWTYSFSVDVLGRVIEVASGEPLNVFLQEKIFGPLGMTDTAFSVPPDKVSRFAVNYGPSGAGLKVVDDAATSGFAGKMTLFQGGAGLVGTASDYMRFLTMIESGGTFGGVRILRPETIELMTTNQVPGEAFPLIFFDSIMHGIGYGLGFSVHMQVDPVWSSGAKVGEFGWGGLASTHDWASPQDHLAVVTLEQFIPYRSGTEDGIKRIIYDAIQPAGR